MDAFHLQGRVDLDTRPAETGLNVIERAARKAKAALDAMNKGRGKSGVASQAQADSRTIQQSAKDAANAQKQAARDAARAQELAAKQAFQANQQNQRLTAQAARDTAKAQAQAARDAAKAQTQSARDAAKAGTQAARDGAKAQTQASRDAAREQARNARDTAKQQIQAARDAAREQARAAREAAKQASDAAKQSARVQEQAQRDATRAAQQAAREQAKAARDAARAEQRASRESARVRKQAMREGAMAASQLSAQFSRAATMGGMAIVGGFGAALGVFDDYDRKLRNINTIAQLSEPNLQKLSNSIRAISADPSIKKGPRDLAKGLYDIYSVGYKGAEALQVLRASAKAASAGLASTQVGVDGITTVLKAHILGVKNAREASDIYFQTVNDGKITFDHLVTSVGKSAQVMAAGGVKFQEYGAYMADATLKGAKAAAATVAFNNLVRKIASPPDKARKAFEELGIKVGYAEMRAVGFTAKMREIAEKTKGSPDLLARLFPDQRAWTAANSIVSRGMEGYNGLLIKQGHAYDGVGAAARAAAKQNQGLSNDVDQAKKNLEEFGLTVATTVVPAATQFLKQANQLLLTFRALPKETQEHYVKLAAYAGIALLVIGRMHGIVTTAGLLIKVFRGLGAAIQTAKIAVSAAQMASAAGEATLFQAALTGLGAVALPLVAVALVAATAAGGAWLINQQKNAESAAKLKAANADLAFSNKQVSLSFDVLRKSAQVDAGASKTVADLAAQYDKLKGSAAGLEKFKSNALPLARQQIALNVKLTMPQRAELNAQLEQVSRQVDANMAAKKHVVVVKAQADRGALANLKEAFYQTYGAIKDFVWKASTTFWTPIVSSGKWAWGQISYVAKTSWDGIKSGMTALGVGLKDAWYSLTGGFESGFNKMLRGLSDAVTTFIGNISRKIGEAATHFWKWYSGQTANHGETDANSPSLGPSAPPVKGAPKSDVWRAAHGLPVGGTLPSYDVGTNFVPRDQIAQVHKGEIIIPAAQANQIRGRRYDLQNRIDALQGRIDTRALSNAKSGNHHRDGALQTMRAEATQLRHELAQLKRESNDAERADKARAREAKANLKDVKAARKTALAQQKRDLKEAAKDVKESAKSYEDASKRIESSTNKTLDKLKTLKDGYAGLFADAQSKLIELGDTKNPLGAMVENLSRLLNLNGQAHDLASGARGRVAGLNIAAQRARDREEALRNQASNLGSSSGFDSGSGGEWSTASLGSASAVGNQIAANALAMQRKYGDQIGKVFSHGCDRLADATVNGATKMFARIMGPRPEDTAAKTMRRFMKAGVGFRANGRYAPGDIVYTDESAGGGSGHVQVVARDGRFADQYGLHKKPTTRPMWVVRAGGAAGQGGNFPVYRPTGASGKGKGKGLTPQGATVLSSMGMSQSDLGVIDEVLRGTVSFNLSSVRALGKGWGKSVKSNDKNSLVFGLQSKLASGEALPLVAQLATALKAASAQGKQIGPPAQNSMAGALLGLQKQGVRLHWKKGWSQQDVALDFLKQIVAAEQARVNATQAAQDAATKSKESMNAQIALVKVARGELQKQNQEQVKSLALLQEQAQFIAAHPGDDGTLWKDYAERKKAIEDFSHSDAIKALSKSGRGAEALRATNDFVGQYDFGKSLEAYMKTAPGTVDEDGAKVVEEVVGKLPSLADAARSATERLQSALTNTDGSAEEMRATLLSLGADEETRSFIAFAQSLQSAGHEADGMRDKYALVLSMLKSANGEWLTRAQKEANAPRVAAQARLSEMAGDIDRRARDASTFDPRARRRNEITDEFKRDGLPIDKAQIDKMVNRDYWMSQVESLSGGLQGIFGDAFSNIEGGFSGMFDSVLDGMKRWLQQMAAEMLTSWVMQQVFGGLLSSLGAKGAGAKVGGFAGGGFSLKGGKASGADLGSGFGLHSKPIKFGGSFATGLDRVFDDSLVQVHKGETILNVQAAQKWRREQNQRDVQTAAMTSSSSAARQSGNSQGASGDGGKHYHFNGPVTIQANNTREFERELPVGNRLPTREARRQGRQALGY